jgi:predicted GNAT superfamily acetyltransferase
VIVPERVYKGCGFTSAGVAYVSLVNQSVIVSTTIQKLHKTALHTSPMIIRQLETPEDYEACENTMKEIWAFDDRDIIPAHVLKAINDQGGLVLGAFNHKKMVGVLVGFLAHYEGILHHHSHITGVLQKYNGVGYQLKQRQREFALSQGLDLVTWTFDPLQSSNAYFNFAKLGVTCSTYYRDYYGEMRDQLNAGLKSDRILVEWWIKSREVIARTNGTFQQPKLDKILSEAEIVNKTKKVKNLRKNVSLNFNLKTKRILIEIPSDINVMKEKNIKLACAWREETRTMFETYFPKGYTAYNVISEITKGERRSYYLLRRGDHENPDH